MHISISKSKHQHQHQTIRQRSRDCETRWRPTRPTQRSCIAPRTNRALPLSPTDLCVLLSSLYLRNIDESIKIPELIDGIKNICSELGEIEQIIAKKNLRARGQAFVVFSSVDDAEDALEFLQGQELFGRKLVVQFAKSKSDIVVKRESGEEALEEHKRERLAQKGEDMRHHHHILGEPY